MNKEKILLKKFLILSSLYFSSFIALKLPNLTKRDTIGYETETTCVDNFFPFAKCKSGDIYIGSSSYIEKCKTLNDNCSCIYIIDQRYSDNPDIKILDSWMIRDEEIMDEILEILIKYNEKYPSNWNRTISSMKKEWKIHNMLYDMGYRVSDVKDVDLDNDDEKWYNYRALIYDIKNSIKSVTVE